jgi:hypothetical protein
MIYKELSKTYKFKNLLELLGNNGTNLDELLSVGHAFVIGAIIKNNTNLL